MTRADARALLPIGAILGLAFVLRVALRAADGAASFWVNGYAFYFTFARSIAAGRGYALANGRPTAWRVPFYPAFIAAVTHGRPDFWSLLVAQALVSTGTVACAYALATQLFDRRTGLVAAALTALYPYYAWHDTALQETGLMTFLSAFAVVLLYAARRSRRPWMAAATGLVLGVGVLTRPTILPFAAFAPLWLLLPAGAGDRLGRRIAGAVLLVAVLALTVSPWLARNHALTGRWTLSTDQGGAVFYGNNPQTFAFYPKRSIDLSAAAARAALPEADRAALRHMTPVEQSDWLLRRGLAYVAAHPGAFVVDAVRKNVAAFGVLPSPRHDWKTDGMAALSYGPILLLALVGAWRTRRRWRALLPIYVQFAAFAAVTGVLWGHSSHRAFLDVYLIVFAAHVLVASWPRVRAAWPSARAPRPA